jgi:hypothetical protein
MDPTHVSDHSFNSTETRILTAGKTHLGTQRLSSDQDDQYKVEIQKSVKMKGDQYWPDHPRLRMENWGSWGKSIDFLACSSEGDPFRGMRLWHRNDHMYLYQFNGDIDELDPTGPDIDLMVSIHNDIPATDIRIYGLTPMVGGVDLVLDPTDNRLYEKVSSLQFKENVQNWDIDPALLMNLQLKQWTMKNSGKNGYGLIAEDVVGQIPEADIGRGKPCLCDPENPNYDQGCLDENCEFEEPATISYDRDFLLWLLIRDYQLRNQV